MVISSTGDVIGPILGLLNYAGLAVFALTGALSAARKRQTLVTFIFFAVITGTGGGTVRDLLIDVPVFWSHGNIDLAICLACAMIVWVLPSTIWSPRALDWLDAAGLAAFAVYGAAKSLSVGIAPVPAAVIGTVSACMGGIIRDILAGDPSIVIRPEIYVTAAALGATLFVLLTNVFGLASPLAGTIAAAAAFILRGGAIRHGWCLPSYRR